MSKWARIPKSQLPAGWYGIVTSSSSQAEAQADCRDAQGDRTLIHVIVDGPRKGRIAREAITAAARATGVTGVTTDDQ